MNPDGAILVIGARGTLGRLVVDAFEASGRRVLRGVRGSAAHPDERPVDLGDPDAVARALAEADLAINCVPDLALTAERCALERGGAVMNVSAMAAAPSDELRSERRPASGTAIVHAGIAPGVTNLVAADLLRRFPDADAVELAFTVSTASTSGSAGADFIHRNLTAVDRHDTAEIPLPEPFGTRTCIGFGEPDRGWIGQTAGARAVRTYICLAEDEANRAIVAANAEHGLGALPRSAFGSGRPPGADGPTHEPVAHWIAVLRDGERLAAATVETRGDYLGAAQSILVLADELAEQAPPAGIYACEEVFDLGGVAPRLRSVGVDVVDRRNASSALTASS